MTTGRCQIIKIHWTTEETRSSNNKTKFKFKNQFIENNFKMFKSYLQENFPNLNNGVIVEIENKSFHETETKVKKNYLLKIFYNILIKHTIFSKIIILEYELLRFICVGVCE